MCVCVLCIRAKSVLEMFNNLFHFLILTYHLPKILFITNLFRLGSHLFMLQSHLSGSDAVFTCLGSLRQVLQITHSTHSKFSTLFARRLDRGVVLP